MWKILLMIIGILVIVCFLLYIFVKNGWHRTAAISFSMYSKIPMPHFEWREEDMKYTLCFFPWIGGVIGVCVGLVGWAGGCLGFHTGFLAAILSVLPLIVSGGIHMDGYLDTIDALSSWQTKERRLEILKDPHTGAFAIIGAGAYFLLNYGCFYQLIENECFNGSVGRGIQIGALFFLSRTLSGLSLLFFQMAKKEGTLYTFAHGAQKKGTTIVLVIYLATAIAAVCLCQPFYGCGMIATAAACFCYYRWMSYHYFGGITGDLAGYFLQLCELSVMVVLSVLGSV